MIDIVVIAWRIHMLHLILIAVHSVMNTCFVTIVTLYKHMTTNNASIGIDCNAINLCVI